MASENPVTSDFKVIQFGLCNHCIQAYVNDDFTGLDYHYNEPEATEQMETIKTGLAKLFCGDNCEWVSATNTDGFIADCSCCDARQTLVYMWEAAYSPRT